MRPFISACAVALAFASVSCKGSPTAPNPVPSCTIVVTPASASVPASGGTTTVHVDTAASCSWTARPEASWISLSATAGSGPADIVVTVSANDRSELRSGLITIADKNMSIRQDGKAAVSCEYALDPQSQTFGPDAGHGRISVQTDQACGWTATASDSWLTIRTGSGTGPGAIEYEFPANSGIAQRETRITVGDRSATVRQDAPAAEPCSYSVDPTSSRMHWHGGTLDVRLTTGVSCTWTAASGGSWLELLSPGSGSGATTIAARVGSFTEDSTRSAPIEVRWPTPTAGQNVWIAQEGCRYAITGDKFKTFSAEGGRADAYVIEQAVSIDCNIPCTWTAEPTVSWIRIVSGSPGAGYDRFTYEVLANTTGAPRSGAIRVMGQVLSITQTP
jgi:hypothetical protein